MVLNEIHSAGNERTASRPPRTSPTSNRFHLIPSNNTFFAPRHSRVRCRRSPIHGISAGDEAASARHQQGAPNYNPALYIHGVVNQEIAGLTAESSAKPSKRAALDPTNASPVKLYGSGSPPKVPQSRASARLSTRQTPAR
jgi:hypothetical protein